MTDQDILVDEIIERLTFGYDEEAIDGILREKRIDTVNYDSIKAAIQAKLLANKMATIPQTNKRRFVVFSSLLLISIILFFFVLPRLNITDGVFFMSVAGALLICFGAFGMFATYRSWTPEVVAKITSNRLRMEFFLPLALIPGGILYFLISWRFSTVADRILKTTQQHATATVISGTNVIIKRMDNANITVSFTTKKGEFITASEDVSGYHFRNFYKGQQLEIIYSEDNPRNIDLLIDKQHIQEFTGSEQRDISMPDLIRLLAVSKDSMLNELNKISIGWAYRSKEKIWYNERNQSIISSDSGSVKLVGNYQYNYTFPKYLLANGFKQLNKTGELDFFKEGEKLYESSNLLVSVKGGHADQTFFSTIAVFRK